MSVGIIVSAKSELRICDVFTTFSLARTGMKPRGASIELEHHSTNHLLVCSISQLPSIDVGCQKPPGKKFPK